MTSDLHRSILGLIGECLRANSSNQLETWVSISPLGTLHVDVHEHGTDYEARNPAIFGLSLTLDDPAAILKIDDFVQELDHYGRSNA